MVQMIVSASRETVDDRGIFVVGCQRSGTTLLRVILNAHPQLCAGEETAFLDEMEKIVGMRWGHLETYDLPRSEVLARIRDFFLVFHHKYCESSSKRTWVDKSPFYIKQLPFVNELFPECKVIHIIRDGRDVAASYKEKWGSKGFFIALKDWVECLRRGREAAGWLGAGRYLEIRYEDLVVEPREALERVMRFLALPWDDALLAHHLSDHPTTKYFGYERPLQPIQAAKVGGWRKRLNFYEKWLVALCFRKLMHELGYLGQCRSSSRLWGVAEEWLSGFGYLMNRILWAVNRRGAREIE